jgi:hypothetical protein
VNSRHALGWEQGSEKDLEQGGLRSPTEAFQVGIFSAGRRTAIGLVGFALGAAFVLFPLFHLLGFFPIAFGDRRFSWSSDGSLLRAKCALK